MTQESDSLKSVDKTS